MGNMRQSKFCRVPTTWEPMSFYFCFLISMATAILSLEPQDILFDVFITIALVALKFSNHHTKHFGCTDGLFSEHHLRDGFHSPLMNNARLISVPSLKDNRPSAGGSGAPLLLRVYPFARCPAQKGHPISIE